MSLVPLLLHSRGFDHRLLWPALHCLRDGMPFASRRGLGLCRLTDH